ncbi:MAG: ATP-binding protein [Euryarchaeota archaeon]|nr:ATP-binding protein [Euryarchaeota archaeon]
MAEERLTDRMARLLWQEAEPGLDERPRTDGAVLVMTAGVPLSGKSRFARSLVDASAQAVFFVENDAVRTRLADAMGRERPEHDKTENFLTYRTAWNLIRIGLENGVHVVHDATNLTERGREDAYHEALRQDASVVVVFVVADRDVLGSRYEAVSEDRQEAYDKLGRKEVDPDACTMPFLVVDGADEADEQVAKARRHVVLRRLFVPSDHTGGRTLVEAREDDEVARAAARNP